MRYEQSTGKLFDEDKLVGIGWAGHLDGRNNPDMEGEKGIGPLPKGIYTIGDKRNDPHLGIEVFPLTPDPKNFMFGRSGFYIHGANPSHPALSSDGCIIQPRVTRDYIDTKIGGASQDSPLRELEVVEGPR